VPANDGISIGFIAPDSREGMLQHAEQFKAAGIPFIFDPGQAMPLFAGEDFKRFISIADWLALNDYEWALLQERHRLERGGRHATCEALIVHAGGEGSTIIRRWRTYRYSVRQSARSARSNRVGDAYRAGLIHGILRGLDWENHGRIAVAHGRHQDRRSRHAEPYIHEGGIRGSIRHCFRHALAGLKSGRRQSETFEVRGPSCQQLFVHFRSVSEGHPDKVSRSDFRRRTRCHPGAGQVLARRRRNAVQYGLVVLAGEITTNAVVDFQQVARDTIKKSATTTPTTASTTRVAPCSWPTTSSRPTSRRAWMKASGLNLDRARRPGHDVRLRVRRNAELMPLPIYSRTARREAGAAAQGRQAQVAAARCQEPGHHQVR
jgi:hypothetical protein